MFAVASLTFEMFLRIVTALLLGTALSFSVYYRRNARTPREEANLVAAFGPAYREYQARTGRYVPRLGRGGRSLAD